MVNESHIVELLHRHAGLDPASTFFLPPQRKEGGPRIKSGVTVKAKTVCPAAGFG
jgi:hypothetical protein